MSDKKRCPVVSRGGKGWVICIANDCGLYDEERKCCGLIQVPAIHHHYHTGVDWGKGKDSTGLCSSSSDPLPDKPIATLNEDGTITGKWAGGTICGGWSQGTDKKGGADNDKN